MKRLTFLLAMGALAGCQTAAPTGPVINPFMGRSTVPPPGTGTPAPAAAPYYGNGQLAPPTVSGSGAPLTPPGSSYRYQGSSLDRSPQWREGSGPALSPESEAPRFESSPDSSQQPAEQVATREPSPENESPAVIRASAEEEASPAVGEPSSDDSTSTSHSVIRIVEPENSTAATSSERESPDGGRTNRWEQQQATARIDGDSSPARTVSAGPRTSFVGFRGSSQEEVPARRIPAETSESQASSPASNSARYGFEPGYTRLRGRLEYSHINREWKLRYIPIGGIDGGNDEFGGSVVLPEVPELDQFESGDFVEIEGKPLPREANEPGFAPRYDLRRIAPLGG